MTDRTRMIRLIHVAKRELALDDDAYRDILERLTGKRSSADLSTRQLDAVLKELKRLGFKPKPAKKAGPMPREGSPQARMIRALWIELGKAGKVRDRSEAALQKWFDRTTGVSHMRFATPGDFNRAIEAIKNWAEREGIDTRD